MEDNKIVKVYSNNSKKSRLKRRKNKFQRIWDAEKQTYVKIRKAKYTVKQEKAKKDWRDVDNSKALKRRQRTKKPKDTQTSIKKAPTSIQKNEIKQPARKQPVKIHTRTESPVTVRTDGMSCIWDSSVLRYKRVA